MTMPKKHILSILVDNEPGVLSRIAGLFSGRGYNIESLCVAETNEPQVSRLTMVTDGDTLILEQIKKQLNKLINVIKVSDLTDQDFVERELVLVKVTAKTENRAEILRIIDIFRGQVVDVGLEHYTLSITGDAEKITAILNLLKPFGIREIARTGCIAMFRETKHKS
ncbi:MAG: acetolactate synthase small subunit [Desulfobacterales bacterium CG23_combo_of_CG06-09_8_20_14_all_51_8]|nr:MAG: acetolactate synthase small subunit [Desulfobacterales bacterium CG23_combo_of_CG06-09_8_20_14_all_51_8]